MTKREELNGFLKSAEELLDSKYILADIKIVGLLKSIAASESIVAVLKSCLNGFDYPAALKKYLVKAQYLGENKGEFVPPATSKEFIALVFNILADIDAKNIVFSEFLNKYFFAGGSCFNSYEQFKNAIIKPFCEFIKVVMESVIDGSILDPVAAIEEEESRLKAEEEKKSAMENEEKEVLKKTYGGSVLKLKDCLFTDKIKVKTSKLKDGEKEEIILLIDMFANVLTSGDKDAIIYAYTAYKFAQKYRKKVFSSKIKNVSRLVENILNAI